jgi:MoaD family protein
MERVRVRLFASLRELAGTSYVEVDAADATDVAAVLVALSRRLGPRFDAIMASGSVVVNEEPAGPERTLSPGDEVALLPPVSGGL